LGVLSIVSGKEDGKEEKWGLAKGILGCERNGRNSVFSPDRHGNVIKMAWNREEM
jgi:hypothetical protein